VLDEQGRKMSKSKGNGIDPLEVIDDYGADALRFAMTYASTGGQDIRWDRRRVEMGRNFNNKLWNAARLAFMNLAGAVDAGPPESLADRWMMSRLQGAVEEITNHLESYDLGLANRRAYDFVWSEFCDWYLEAAKPALRAGDARSRYVLRWVLESILKLLHPLIPFITSELYQAMGAEQQLGWADWPRVDKGLLDEQAEQEFGHLQDAVTAVRNLRGDANVAPTRAVDVFVEGKAATVIEANKAIFEALARATLLPNAVPGASLSRVIPDLTLYLPLEGLIEVSAWLTRQEKRLAELRIAREKSARKLANEKFIANAPAAVVAEEKRRLAEAEQLMEGIEVSLARLER